MRQTFVFYTTSCPRVEIGQWNLEQPVYFFPRIGEIVVLREREFKVKNVIWRNPQYIEIICDLI